MDLDWKKAGPKFSRFNAMHAKITKEKCLAIPDEQLMKFV